MKINDKFTNWAIELQSLAQAGLEYGHDKFDLERYSRIREIATEMMSEKIGLPIKRVKTLFSSEDGYQTPKIDTRAAIIKNDQMIRYYLLKKKVIIAGLYQVVGVKLIFQPKEIVLKKPKKNQAEILKSRAINSSSRS